MSGSDGSANKAVNQRNKMFYKTKTISWKDATLADFFLFFLDQSANFMNPENPCSNRHSLQLHKIQRREREGLNVGMSSSETKEKALRVGLVFHSFLR